MSFRPTVAVFAQGRIADLCYCRNWDEKDLFFLALRIALSYSECGSIEEYRRKRFGAQRISYVLSPVLISNTQKNLRELLTCSEFPVAVDLTAGCIYVSERPLSKKRLERLPSVFDPDQSERVSGILDRNEFATLLARFRIPFGGLDRELILRLLDEL